jgi:hypothetical protein
VVSGAQVGARIGGFQGLPVITWRSAVMTSAPCLRARAASKSRDHGCVVRRHAKTGVFASGMVDIAGGWGGCDGCGGAADLRG